MAASAKYPQQRCIGTHSAYVRAHGDAAREAFIPASRSAVRSESVATPAPDAVPRVPRRLLREARPLSDAPGDRGRAQPAVDDRIDASRASAPERHAPPGPPGAPELPHHTAWLEHARGDAVGEGRRYGPGRECCRDAGHRSSNDSTNRSARTRASSYADRHALTLPSARHAHGSQRGSTAVRHPSRVAPEILHHLASPAASGRPVTQPRRKKERRGPGSPRRLESRT